MRQPEINSQVDNRERISSTAKEVIPNGIHPSGVIIEFPAKKRVKASAAMIPKTFEERKELVLLGFTVGCLDTLTTPKQSKVLEDMYIHDMTARHVREELGVTRQDVNDLQIKGLSRLKMFKEKRVFRVNGILRLFASRSKLEAYKGKSIVSIANDLGVSPYLVKREMKLAGIETARPGRQAKVIDNRILAQHEGESA